MRDTKTPLTTAHGEKKLTSHPKLATIFIAGTDTDVGKTYTAAQIARSLHKQGIAVGVYKPVASGCVRSANAELIAEDAVQLWEAAGQPRTLAEVCPQRFELPLAPPEAAAAEGKEVDPQLLISGLDSWRQDSEVLIVEGAGGLFSPLAEGLLNIDLAKQVGGKLVIVAANRLGVIHQTLATCAAAAHHDFAPSAIILCSPSEQTDESVSSNADYIKQYTDTPLLGSVSYNGDASELAIDRLLRD